MKTIKSGMPVILALVLCGTVWTALGGTNEVLSPVRLEITLVDGSCVIGVPIIQAVPLQTAYAKIQIPLMKILAIDIRDDHETATFALENGDTLTGVIRLEPITLATVFGAVAITSEHVKGIRVVPSGGALSESVKKRRVLYYTFDREEGEKENQRLHHGQGVYRSGVAKLRRSGALARFPNRMRKFGIITMSSCPRMWQGERHRPGKVEKVTCTRTVSPGRTSTVSVQPLS